ncbi:MAG: glycosyltransferase, partial [Anaerolineae bacterium]|nr:glycosyltransferase [Anaerolineae bacterium]
MLVLLRLIPIKVQDHLLPLLAHPDLTHLTLIRREPAALDSPKVSQYNLDGEISENVPEYSTFQQIGKVIHLFWKALRTAQKEQPDVIYGIYLIPYGIYAWLIARLTGKKCLVSLIGTDLNKDVLELPLRRFWQGILKRMDGVTVFDESARQKLLVLGFDPSKVHVLPHAIDMSRYQRENAAPVEFDALYTGHLWELKEVKRIIAAWKEVVTACPNARLAILGEGETRSTLEKQAAELGISDNVIFAGWVKDVPAWLSRARVFINLSSEEGVPMS